MIEQEEYRDLCGKLSRANDRIRDLEARLEVRTNERDNERLNAEHAHQELSSIKSASEDWMEETGQAYCYIGIRDYAAINERLEETERLLAALWRYGTLHPVEGVIYPETGSHKQTLEAANEYLLKRAVEKERANGRT